MACNPSCKWVAECNDYLRSNLKECIMWIDDLPPDGSWTSLWSGYIRCGNCSGIRTFSDPCLACGTDLPQEEHTLRLEDGQEISILPAYMGAETRYEDYVYLQLMEREWERMTRDLASQNRLPHTDQVSTGASLVLLFWTYFETRLEQLLRDGLKHVPSSFLEDALSRYSSVGARLERFYKIAFSSTYHTDLVSLGHSDVSTHLIKVQKQRNAFVHGLPQSIDNSLAISVVEMLKGEHEAWIAVYNHRVSKTKTN